MLHFKNNVFLARRRETSWSWPWK